MPPVRAPLAHRDLHDRTDRAEITPEARTTTRPELAAVVRFLNCERQFDSDRALGRLAGAGRMLANPNLLVQPYLTAEALASSRIEGTQASLSEIFEAAVDREDSSNDDVRVVHARLLQGVRGEEPRLRFDATTQ